MNAVSLKSWPGLTLPLGLALLVLSFVSACAEDARPSAPTTTGTGNTPPAETATAAPDLGEPPTSRYQEELLRLAPEGWMVWAKDGSFDGRNAYVVARFRSQVYEPGLNHRAAVYLVSDSTLSPVWELQDEAIVVDFDKTFRDLNGDGIGELGLYAGTGGNAWCGGSLHLVSFRGSEHFELAVEPIPDAAPLRVEDANGDGIFEVLSIDCTWENHAGFCHACSPSALYVLLWDNDTGRYTEASRQFPDYYLARIAELEAKAEEELTGDLTDRIGECGRDNYYVGTAVSIFLNYEKAGMGQEGWARLQELTAQEKLVCQEWKDSLPELLETLRARYLGG